MLQSTLQNRSACRHNQIIQEEDSWLFGFTDGYHMRSRACKLSKRKWCKFFKWRAQTCRSSRQGPETYITAMTIPVPDTTH